MEKIKSFFMKDLSQFLKTGFSLKMDAFLNRKIFTIKTHSAVALIAKSTPFTCQVKAKKTVKNIPAIEKNILDEVSFFICCRPLKIEPNTKFKVANGKHKPKTK